MEALVKALGCLTGPSCKLCPWPVQEYLPCEYITENHAHSSGPC